MDNKKLWDGEWKKWRDNNIDYANHKYENFYIKPDIHNTRYRRAKWVLDLIKEHKDVKTILDAGCGLGWHSDFFVKEGFEVEGRDISPIGIEVAKRLVLGAKFKVEDINKMEDENAYDAVLALSVLICIDDIDDAIARLYKATKKYLYLTFELFNTDKTHLQMFTLTRIHKLLEGLNITKEKHDDKYYFVEITK